MAVVSPAPAVVFGFSLLTIVELICLANLIFCIAILSVASIYPVDYSGIRVSGYFQCMNAAWFVLGIPMTIIGGVGAFYRVAIEIKAFLGYLIGTLAVAIAWLGVIIRFAKTCKTIVPLPGESIQKVVMICSRNGRLGSIIFMVLVVAVTGAAIYFVWSMLQNIKERAAVDLTRCQEPWQNAVLLADDAAAAEAKQRQQAVKQHQRFPARSPFGYFDDPDKIRHLSNQLPLAYGLPPNYGAIPPKLNWVSQARVDIDAQNEARDAALDGAFTLDAF